MTIAAKQPIAVAITRFEDIVGRGLTALVQEDPNLSLLAAGVPPEHLAATLAEHAPDVAILNFAGLTGAAELRDLHASFPQIRLVVLVNDPSTAECRQLIGFGAAACLSKTIEGRDLLHAIHLASRGLQVLPAGGSQAYGTSDAAPLTAREADVLELLQDGRSNAEIAAVLQVGIETVRTHVRHIYRKLGVSTRRELRLTS